MKNLILMFVAVAAAPLSSLASADPITKEVMITVSDVLVPSKISANDDAKVVVSGIFPNTCYSWSRGESVSNGEFKHTVHAYALVTQTMCLMVLVPYTKEINLGHLSRGEHTLRFVNGDETWFEKTMTVE